MTLIIIIDESSIAEGGSSLGFGIAVIIKVIIIAAAAAAETTTT
jgi:hypothetical protein